MIEMINMIEITDIVVKRRPIRRMLRIDNIVIGVWIGRRAGASV
jgi:hypothetical protein